MDWCLERCGTLPQRFSASLAGNIHGVACAAQQLPPCGGSSGGSPPATPGRRRPRRPKSRSRRQGPAPGAEHSDTLSETLFQGNGRLAESAAHVFRAPKHILCARQCRIRTADPGSRAALGHPPEGVRHVVGRVALEVDPRRKHEGRRDGVDRSREEQG